MDTPRAYVWHLQNFVLGEHILTPSTDSQAHIKACAINACGNFAILGTEGGWIRVGLNSSTSNQGSAEAVTLIILNLNAVLMMESASIQTLDFANRKVDFANRKRTIMEVVTAMLSGGLQGGDVLHGKNDRDDKHMLFQAGISHNVKIENQGFILEPHQTCLNSQTLVVLRVTMFQSTSILM